MSIKQHPDTEELIAYLENPGAEVFTDICLHLASCAVCRQQSEKLMNLEKTMKRDAAELFHQEKNNSPEMQQASEQGLIEAYVDQQLQGEPRAAIASLIEREPQALKAALHYASHSAAMNRDMQPPESTAETEPQQPVKPRADSRAGWRERLGQWFNPSLWVAVPVTALATALLVAGLTPLLLPTKNITVASYQDNPVIQFQDRDQLPGIGFFTNAFNVIKPFNKVAVTIVDTDSIRIDWPKVDKAASYTLQLQMIDNGQKVILAEKTTEKNSINISGLDTRVDHRYEWILSGRTTEAQKFYTTGGFVINHQDR